MKIAEVHNQAEIERNITSIHAQIGLAKHKVFINPLGDEILVPIEIHKQFESIADKEKIPCCLAYTTGTYGVFYIASTYSKLEQYIKQNS